ncbi:MAG: hypothetical protein U0350_47035 [Caldilineaceae bacterium]
MLEPGALWEKVQTRSVQALQTGALQSIPTHYELLEENGIPFIVRMLTNLARKEAARPQAAPNPAFDPFLPYDPALFVADLSATHVCLLNKFNVVAHHLLIVTRAFVEQETLLNLQDFAALWTCMCEFDGLAFYNGGKVAGASQRHKHLQYVSLPLGPNGQSLPMEAVLAAAQFQGGVGCAPNLPYVHAVAHLPADQATAPSDAAPLLLTTYQTLLASVGLAPETAIGDQQPDPYNLLVTRRWMMIVPRAQEKFGSISVNSLGFAGSLLVKNQEEMALVKNVGPLNVLKGVGVAR